MKPIGDRKFYAWKESSLRGYRAFCAVGVIVGIVILLFGRWLYFPTSFRSILTGGWLIGLGMGYYIGAKSALAKFTQELARE